MAPKLDDDAINDVNAIASYLALTNELDVRKDGNGVVILAGNAILATAEAAFEIAVSRGVPVLISGGRGHSTELLEEAIRAHPHYGNIVTGGRAEAEMLGDLAVRYCSIPSDRIHLETASTNCGENASCSLASLNRLGLHPNGRSSCRTHSCNEERMRRSDTRGQKASSKPASSIILSSRRKWPWIRVAWFIRTPCRADYGRTNDFFLYFLAKCRDCATTNMDTDPWVQGSSLMSTCRTPSSRRTPVSLSP